jgi:two-component system, NarL family, sensor histidine kinase UhpB
VNLRIRVALLILGLFVAGSLVALLRSVALARDELQSELGATHALIDELLATAWAQQALRTDALNSPDAQSPPHFSADFLTWLAVLAEHQHFDAQVLAADQHYPPIQPQVIPSLQAPVWFAELLNPERSNSAAHALEFQVVLGNGVQGSGDVIQVRLNPTVTINTMWLVAKQTFLFRLAAVLLFIVAVYALLGWWLQPIKYIVAGLDEVVKGDYGRKIPATALPEFAQITQRINNLTAVLGSSKSDNERLQAEAISAQEQERLRLAQELHDTLGQTLSAIKAMAVSIGLRTQGQLPAIAEHAEQIEKVADTAYGSVRDMMKWLRPVVLDELGLAFGLQQLVDDWNVHHEHTFCRLSLETALHDLSGEQAINIYRIVQEALTNVVKHADATEVAVQLSGFQVLSLLIIDNGRGFDPDLLVKGMGLRGMQDRVNLLAGTLEVQSRPQQGVRFQIEFPRHPSSHRRRHERKDA